MEVVGVQNRPTRPRRLAAQIQETTGPAAAPETHVAKTPGPAAPRQTSEFIGSVLGMFAVTMCIFVMFVIVMVFGFTLNSRNIEKTHAYLAELREAAETSFESLNKIAQFVDYSESRPPAVAGFPVVIPAERMTENSPEIVLLPNATAYCRADLTHCIFDNVLWSPWTYSVLMDPRTGLAEMHIEKTFEVWLCFIPYVADALGLVGLVVVVLFMAALILAPDLARHRKLDRFFTAAVRGKRALTHCDGIDMVCGPDGMTLEAGIVVFLACARFDKAHAAGLARGDDENTLSAALRGRHRGDGAVYTLTPRLALTWRANGMPRIALDGVVSDGGEIPPE